MHAQRPAECAVYPRVGGGNALSGRRPGRSGGLSPRGRGKPSQAQGLSPRGRSIPAWAGETRGPQRRFPVRKVYPRVGGGNAARFRTSVPAWGLSPRGRGKRCRRPRIGALSRSIPAWAGETRSAPSSSAPARVYPRVGGGNARVAYNHALADGLSPRGRGKRACAIAHQRRRRSIPAWAGETGAAPA